MKIKLTSTRQSWHTTAQRQQQQLEVKAPALQLKQQQRSNKNDPGASEPLVSPFSSFIFTLLKLLQNRLLTEV